MADDFQSKKLLGEQLRRDFEAMVAEVYSSTKETMSIDDWRVMVAVWLHSRQEVLEPMQYVLDYYAAAQNEPPQEVRAGKFKEVIVLHPSENRAWKNAFVRFAGSCIGVALSQNFKDIWTWLSFMSGKTSRQPRRIDDLDELGI